MAITVVGSVYDIPEGDLLNFINSATGSNWLANESRVSSVTPVVVDGVTTGIRVGIETGN